jgi:hypothetical protein
MIPRQGDPVLYRRSGEVVAAIITEVPNGDPIPLVHLTTFLSYGRTGSQQFVPPAAPDGHADGWFHRPPVWHFRPGTADVVVELSYMDRRVTIQCGRCKTTFELNADFHEIRVGLDGSLTTRAPFTCPHCKEWGGLFRSGVFVLRTGG